MVIFSRPRELSGYDVKATSLCDLCSKLRVHDETGGRVGLKDPGLFAPRMRGPLGVGP